MNISGSGRDTARNWVLAVLPALTLPIDSTTLGTTSARAVADAARGEERKDRECRHYGKAQTGPEGEGRVHVASTPPESLRSTHRQRGGFN